MDALTLGSKKPEVLQYEHDSLAKNNALQLSEWLIPHHHPGRRDPAVTSAFGTRLE